MAVESVLLSLTWRMLQPYFYWILQQTFSHRDVQLNDNASAESTKSMNKGFKDCKVFIIVLWCWWKCVRHPTFGCLHCYKSVESVIHFKSILYQAIVQRALKIILLKCRKMNLACFISSWNNNNFTQNCFADGKKGVAHISISYTGVAFTFQLAC